MLKSRLGVIFAQLAIVFVLGSGVVPLQAQTSGNKDWTLNLKDVALEVFLEQVSAITGENFVVDPQVKGRVSVIATTPMNRDTVKEVMLSVLRVNALVAVPSGQVTRIIPQGTTRFTDGAGGSRQKIITRVLPVKNANVAEIVKLLKPLGSANGYLDGSEFSSAVIVSDYADNIAYIAKTLASLDKDNSTDVEVIALKETSVANIVPLIEAIAPLQLTGPAKDYARLRVVANEQGNSIIIRGDAKERAQIRKLVETFDQKTANASSIQMIHLQYADAREIASILRGSVSTQEPKKLSSTPAGGATPEGAAARATTGSSGAALSSSGSASGSQATDISGAGSFIQADVTHNTLIVKAEPGLMKEIIDLVKQLDTRRPQVLIEAAIVEISASASQQLGVQLASGDTTQSIHAGSTQFSPSGIALGNMLTKLGNLSAAAVTGEGLSVALGSSANFNLLVQALASTTGVNLLSTPSIITLDNEEAKIVVGQNVPFRTGDFSTQSSGVTNPFTTIERQDIGVTLKVIPQIHEGNLVSLGIEQEVSSIAPATAQNSGAADIITNKRTITTKVLAEDKETIVLGGLMEDDATQSESKVPLLGDIPWLGTLFRYKSQTLDKRNLVVFLRPTVVRGKNEMADITQSSYGRIYDLQLGRKDIMAPGAIDNRAVAAMPAGGIFNPPSKQLPTIFGSTRTVQPVVNEPDPAPVSTEPLPWQSDKNAPAMQIPPAKTYDNAASTLPVQINTLDAPSSQPPAIFTNAPAAEAPALPAPPNRFVNEKPPAPQADNYFYHVPEAMK